MTTEQRQALDEAIAEAQKWALQVQQCGNSPDMLDEATRMHDAAVQNVVNIAKAFS